MRATFASLAALGLVAIAPPDAAAEPELKVSGFVDTSLFIPILAEAGSKDVLIGLDQVEVDFDVDVNKRIQVRTDLNFFPSAGGPITFDGIVEQGFMQFWFDPDREGLWLKAGKSNAPVGIEAIDAPDMFTFSHGNVFTLLEPSNLTGFWLGYTGESFGAQLWVTNDWDLPATPKSASVGARGEGSFGDLALGLSVMYGPLVKADENGPGGRLMVDLDVKLTAGDFTGWLGGNFGMVTDTPPVPPETERGSATNFGGVLMGNYAFSKRESATLRVDYVGLDGESNDLMGITGAFLFGLGVDGIGGVLEVRADVPMESAEGVDRETSLYAAIELIGIY